LDHLVFEHEEISFLNVLLLNLLHLLFIDKFILVALRLCLLSHALVHCMHIILINNLYFLSSFLRSLPRLVWIYR
jgi:hypothetical protein